ARAGAMTDSGNQARERIFGAIRRSLKRQGQDGAEDADRRLAERPQGPQVQRARLPREQQVELFIEKLEGVQATVARVASPAALPEAVADYLKSHNLPTAIRVAPDPALTGLPWQEKAPLL